jgi:AraC family transcriptional regulator
MRLSRGRFIGQVRREVVTRDFTLVEVRDRPAEEIPLHTHVDPHVLVVLEGAYRTSARGVGPICDASTVIFNPAGTTHRDRFRTRGGRFLTVSPDPGAIDDPRILSTDAMPPTGFDRGYGVWLAARLYREWREPDALSAIVLEALAAELFVHVSRSCAGESQGTPPPWLSRAREVLEDRHAEPIRIRDLAAEIGVEPRRLTRGFRRHFRASPGEYLRACRLRRGAELLRSSGRTIGRIACEIGYGDHSQFTKSFSRATGMTPTAFRALFGRESPRDKPVPSAQDEGSAGE